MKTYQINQEGFYGEFGGAFVPEVLQQCITELKEAYLQVLESEDFKEEFNQLLRDYVGDLLLYFWLSTYLKSTDAPFT